MRGELNSNRWDLKPAWKEGMMFQFCCIWKGPIILMEMFRQFISGRAYIIFYQRKWIFFCQNDHNETTTVMSFKRTCAWNGIFDESALIHFVSGVFFFTSRSRTGLKFPFDQNYRYEIHIGLSFISPQFIWSQAKSWLNIEMRLSNQIKSHTGLSSFRLSCERTLKEKTKRFETWK